MDARKTKQQLKPYYEILQERRGRLFGASPITSLKEFCLKNIYGHARFFLLSHLKTGINPFDQLSNSLKTNVLAYYQVSHETWGTWQQLLMNKLVTNLKVSIDIQNDEDSMHNFCASLAVHQPQLQTLTWTTKSICKPVKSIMLLAYITSSQHFANLKYLYLRNFICNDLDLQMIGCHLKNLRELYVRLDAVTPKGICALAALDQLQEFYFHEKSPGFVGNKLYTMCLLYLPKLYAIGEYEVNIGNIDTTTAIRNNDDFKIDFAALPTPFELGLRQLVLQGRVGRIPKGISFSNLTSLCLWRRSTYVRLDARFCNVTEIGLFELSMDECLRTLQFLGHQIRRMAILESRRRLKLDLILRLCPNLEELNISLDGGVHITFTSALDPQADLENLKGLLLSLNDCKLLGTPGTLVQLLSAPNLQRLALYFINLTKEEAEDIVRLVQDGKILQKLKDLQILNSVIDPEDHRFDQEYKDRYDWVFDNMAKHCPRLCNISDNLED